MQTPLAMAWCSVLLLLSGAPVTGNADNELSTLQDEFFEWQLKRNPFFSSDYGKKKYNHLVTNYSIQFFDEELTQAREFIRDAKNISQNQLSEGVKNNYDVLLDMLEGVKGNYQWRFYCGGNPVNFREKAWDITFFMKFISLDNLKDYQNYVKRLQAWPTMDGVLDTISEWMNELPTNKYIYTKLVDALKKSSFPLNDKRELKTKARSALRRTRRALGELKADIENYYMPNTRATPYVNVSGFYDACLRWHISATTTAQEVHHKGQEEMLRIKGLMEQIRLQQNFHGSLYKFYTALKADPQFSYNSSDEIVSAYNHTIIQVFSKLNNLFRYMPPSDIQIRNISHRTPPVNYVPGNANRKASATFIVSTSDPTQMKTFETIPFTLKIVIGYHLQISLQAYGLPLPEFRKYATNYYDFSAPYEYTTYDTYRRGWALYTMSLGQEMGLYTRNIDKMGWYAADLYETCRLVVDTGIHHLKWTRLQAVSTMQSCSYVSRAEAEEQVRNIITWPGLYSANKFGELKIKELREEASSSMRDRFNLKDFHSAILDCGPVPTSILEKEVDKYINANSG